MANSVVLEPFIKEKEAGLSKNTADKASQNPCPFPFKGVSGWHTNKGVTWLIWSSKHGTDQASADRFFAMGDEDWLSIYKPLFWDKTLGDKMNSQRIANLINDWCWTSGQRCPEKDTQEVLNHIGGRHIIEEDGSFGDKTIELMNNEDENELYKELIQRHLQFIDNIVEKDPSQNVFKQGWINRVNDLVKFNLKFV